jgi:hypothetical protein
MVGASGVWKLMLSKSLDGLARHDLADLVRGLGARCAARQVATAATREAWKEVADDVQALARHDDQRAQYTAAQRAARAMSAADVGEAIDVLCDLTGETPAEWAQRVAGEMAKAARS